LAKDANVYNAYLPYIHKTLKLMGDARWHQVNPNDTIDSRQFTYVGRTTPQISGGFSSFISYKGFSLYAQFDYALGFVILNNEKLRGLSQVQGSQNSTIDVLNTWSPSNPNGTLPRFYWANQGRNYATDASGNNPAANFWEKGDYLMVRELTLGYELTPQVLKQTLNNTIHGARFFITGNNLAYFTKYSGNFPEIGGVDNGKFPLPRRLTLGVNLTL
ncbi:MAG: SusC/RagA family TonB-linked outer membrane protein, partial [Bacteroidota bacterium]|nr:SusC/RagA family TonB-linked outer membrane protein [Bacteroidota bacterium]